ncbi:UDP-N-acetylglucosamine 2-epimerase [Dermabacteraceae bacterium P13095]
MFAFVVGTTAEVIKVAPVMRELRERGEKYQLWCTDQHVTGMSETLRDLDIAEPDIHFISDKHRAHIASTGQVPGWFARLAWAILRHRRALSARLASDGKPGVVIVHGDTFSTVIGALIGRLLRVNVAHVEAGLRSGSWKNPFPEEANRRIVGKIATIHYAPTEVEVKNLEDAKAPGRVVLTDANTVVDALRFAMDSGAETPDLPENFGLVTLHRFELLRDSESFTAIVRALAEAAKDYPLVMLAGQSERTKLRELGLDSLFSDDGNLRLIAKRPYASFLPVLTRADFVVTDSGGLQEECAALGVPCAVHRLRTERFQGIGENVVLTKLDLAILRDFLANWRELRRPSLLDTLHPSRIIADDLQQG